MSNKSRGVATVVVLIGWMAVNWFLNVAAPVVSAELAGKQFENSNVSYGVSRLATFFNGSGLSLLVVGIVLLAIWWRPLKGLFAGAAVIALLVIPLSAHAYYEKSDYTEAYTILPNESAFWIPDVGANKDSQVKLDSADYLRANKIAAKRFIIPHQKFQGSGLFTDFYIPAGRLIIVDRTPYSREWVKDTARGTSNRDESFPCQSKEGLNIGVGVSIGTSVSEENSPNFLYHFGVLPPLGDRHAPEIIFTSVYYGRSLVQVMDDVGRKKVQTLVCNEISKRTFDKANEDMVTIEEAATTAARDYFAFVGITLDFMGWADTWQFDHEVQAAINRRYAAEKDKASAELLRPYADTIQQLATAQALRTFADKFNGRLPNTVLLPPEVLSGVMGMTAAKKTAIVTTPQQ